MHHCMDSPAHKKFKKKTFVWCLQTRQKLQALYPDAVEIKFFIVISSMKQSLLFLATPIYIGTKVLLDQFGRQL